MRFLTLLLCVHLCADVETHDDYILHRTHNERGQLIQTVHEDLTTGELRESRHRYASNGQPVGFTDWLGREITLELTPEGYYRHLPPIRTGENSWEKRREYQSFPTNGAVVVSDSMGNEMTVEISQHGPTRRIYSDGTSESFDYSPEGRLLSQTSRMGIKTHYERDERGQVVATRRESGDLSSEDQHPHREYDLLGRATLLYKGEQVHNYLYDSEGRVIQDCLLAPDCVPFTRHWVYDSEGRVIEERHEGASALLFKRSRSYDSEGRTIAIITGDDSEQQWLYNGFGEVIAYTAPDGSQTRVEYDYTAQFEGHPVLAKRTTDPDGVETLTYEDGEGHLLHLQRPGQTVDYFYDLCGRLIGQTDNEEEILRQYSPEGWVTSVTQEGATTRYAYNCDGQITQIIKPSGVVIDQEYDALGRRIGLTAGDLSYTYAPEPDYDHFENGLSIERTLDSRGRLTKLLLPDSSSITFEWGASHLLRISRNGYTHDYLDYNLWGLPTRESPAFDHGELIRRYDNSGRILEIAHPSFRERVEERDCHGRVLSASGSRYSYDQRGRLFDSSTDALTFDADRRLIQRDSTHFTYDDLNRLIRIEGGEFAREYTYDRFDRRMTCTYYTSSSWGWTATHTTRFIHYDTHEIGELDESGTFLSLRVLPPHSSESVMVELSGELYVPIHDHRGCVRALLSRSGLAATYSYTPHGLTTSSHLSNPYCFSSQPTDLSSGLVSYGTRLYDPHSHRWLAPTLFNPAN